MGTKPDDGKRPLPKGVQNIEFGVIDGERFSGIRILCDLDSDTMLRALEAFLGEVRRRVPQDFVKEPPIDGHFYWYNPEKTTDLILVKAMNGIGYGAINGEQIRMTDMYGQWWPEPVDAPIAAYAAMNRLRLVRPPVHVIKALSRSKKRPRSAKKPAKRGR
jgi:hypothetical protein